MAATPGGRKDEEAAEVGVVVALADPLYSSEKLASDAAQLAAASAPPNSPAACAASWVAAAVAAATAFFL